MADGPASPTRVGVAQGLVVGLPALTVLLAAPGPSRWSLASALLGCAALALRDRHPRLTVLLCLPGLAWGLGWPPTLVALYALGRRCGRLQPAMPWAVLCGLAAVLPLFAGGRLRWTELVLAVVAAVLYSGGPVALGSLMATREQLEASLRDLEAAREATVRAREEVARAAERDRIGREIHDSVGHHATMIAVGAAALAATSLDEPTREAANRIRLLAKRALSEMRSALGLHGNDSEVSSGIAALPELVERARESGMRVKLTGVDGLGDDLPLGVERTAYRLAQESLTNAAKHAEGAEVEIRLERWSRELRITVTNGPPPRHRVSLPATRPGGGLAGLAERIGMMGGRLRARPTPKGGFSVQGRLPTPSLEDGYEVVLPPPPVPEPTGPAPVQPEPAEAAPGQQPAGESGRGPADGDAATAGPMVPATVAGSSGNGGGHPPGVTGGAGDTGEETKVTPAGATNDGSVARGARAH